MHVKEKVDMCIAAYMVAVKRGSDAGLSGACSPDSQTGRVTHQLAAPGCEGVRISSESSTRSARVIHAFRKALTVTRASGNLGDGAGFPGR